MTASSASPLAGALNRATGDWFGGGRFISSVASATMLIDIAPASPLRE